MINQSLWMEIIATAAMRWGTNQSINLESIYYNKKNTTQQLIADRFF